MSVFGVVGGVGGPWEPEDREESKENHMTLESLPHFHFSSPSDLLSFFTYHFNKILILGIYYFCALLSYIVLTCVLTWRVHLSHAGGRGVGLLQGLEDGVGRDVCRLAAVLGLALAVLHRLPPPRLVLVVRVILLVLHAQPLRLLHERPLLALVEQSGREKESLRIFLLILFYCF